MPIIRPCILNINKPIGWTSRDILNKLQSLYGLKKFGHAGTLDPLASGVLIVLASDMTKKQDYFMTLEKVYKTRIYFGIDSPTKDLEGPFTLDKNMFKLSIYEQQVTLYLESLIGVHEQMVPFYSAVKVNGKELYKHARTGADAPSLPIKEVELKKFIINDAHLAIKDAVPKDITEMLNTETDYAKKLELINKNFPFVELTLTTSKGFYVRALARDMGAKFGTKAVMGSLIRESVGDYKVGDSLDISYFEDTPDLV